MHEKKDIFVNSPIGSGNVFCQHLIDRNLRVNITFGRHDIDKFQEGVPNIFILRNPYDSIAHALETRAGILQEEFNKNPGYFIEVHADILCENYLLFLNKAKSLNFIKTVTFELVTENPGGLIQMIGKEFNIDIRPNKFFAKEVLDNIRNTPDIADKAPKPKSNLRMLIDNALLSHGPIKRAFDQYTEYKNVIQSTENMLQLDYDL